VIRSVKTPGIHRAVAGTAAGLLAVAGVLTDGGAATADTTLTLRHPVMDTTHLHPQRRCATWSRPSRYPVMGPAPRGFCHEHAHGRRQPGQSSGQ